ncbi:2-hydroxymuconate tautomerase [Duganella radicis]|uniref:Tautomerase n=1 Tax=Duganella radicis TaxID=551988 RepID=A0A6L6PFY8_9BURK|nr:2-hydroxymuconate tautomerase [Duganella radicis]MTV37195.1 2-hydroxymuconate tautomerase family protein [Duganella radicis]
MPVIHVHLMEGRSDTLKEALIGAITAATAETLGAKPDSVRVLLHELPKNHFGIGGQSAKALGR